MNMIFGVKDRPKFGQTILFAIQQLLAIMAATLVVPVITNGATGSTLSPAAAKPTSREIRPPQTSRANRSRPTSSVPSQCVPEGAAQKPASKSQ